jgi:RNA polymerase sigma factor (sigma-70 family)
MLVRALDPDPEHTHPLYPVKLDAVGYGLLVPVFFVTSGLTLDLRGLVEHPAALATVPAFLLALLVVRGLPALAFRRELPAPGAPGTGAAAGDLAAVPHRRDRRSAGRWACSTRPSPPGSSRPVSCRCWCSRLAVALLSRVAQPVAREPVYCARVLVADAQVVARLRAGDEAAFAEVVAAWSPAMLRVARAHVHSHATAEEVVQEAWLGVLRALDRFEGRAQLRTWVFRILVNVARRHGKREARMNAELAGRPSTRTGSAATTTRLAPALARRRPARRHRSRARAARARVS